ncbi:abortive infection system antitoxin AbiGi family protein [Sphingobacterium griseoflavum]|uniref:Abortive phage resistance protein AbiGi, antitoxin n=1 Tax=Sphingobacterium griseoflavum TaxID=1474952 RepID=A0ABQ3HZ70_9SPHI|nr:abortive infection system antitoxin AbiGi family protein [Sphingobacterium griseoflavum]GHE49614.1 hypothetical protein GCM10017764_35810 [Sphingobacterium griseoflavum]
MAISTNSIIHYTAESKALLGILRQKGFIFSYCSEKLKTREKKSYTAAIAMVSFCDIPISDYKKHFFNKKNTKDLGYYGDYGIGLSKNWASRKGLNPVIYIDHNSHASHSFRKTYEDSLDEDKRIKNIDISSSILYVKNYEGELKRKGDVVSKKYRFYDEREWRLVPKTTEIGNNAPVIDDGEYQKNRVYFNTQIEKFFLSFDFEDISYIIVKETSEVKEIYNEMEQIFNKNISDLHLITVLTSEQIVGDF